MKEKADLLLQDLPRDNVVAVDNALKMLAADEQLSEMSIVNTDNTVIFSSKDDKRIETHDRDVPAAYRQAAEVMRQWYNLDNKKALPTFAVGNAFFQRKIHVSGIIAGLKQMVRH